MMDVRAQVTSMHFDHPTFGGFEVARQPAHSGDVGERKWGIYAHQRGAIKTTGSVFDSLDQAQTALFAAFATLEEAEPIRQEVDRLAAELASVHAIANDMLDPTTSTGNPHR